jgi:outer membrane protein OmpA-like peptidoglycan-associated protein
VFRALAIICFVFAGCSRPVTFQEDNAIWIIAPPLPSAPRAAVQDDAIVVWGNIQFDENATISPTSFDVLNEVASLSKTNPGIKRIVVEKSELSASCAKALLAYLVRQGVASDVAISQAPDQSQAMTPAAPATQPARNDNDKATAHDD